VAELRERREIAARSAAEIEDREGRLGCDVSQQRGDVLAHVVTARAVAEVFGALVVVRERSRGDLAQVVRRVPHSRPGYLPFLRGRAGAAFIFAKAAAFF
jgi:hypothetical protein